MNRQQTLALLSSGSEAWLSWSLDLQHRREALEKDGLWLYEADGEGRNAETRQWIDDAAADFSTKQQPHVFELDVDLSRFAFPGSVLFESAVFKGAARFVRSRFLLFATFREAIFHGEADFDGATFSGAHPAITTNLKGADRVPNARFTRNVDFSNVQFLATIGFRKAIFERTVWFNEAKFGEDAWFRQVQFLGDAPFDHAEFSKEAWFLESRFENEAWFKAVRFRGATHFDQSRFLGGATFASAQFDSVAIFRACHCGGAFSFSETEFADVPDFVQAHFSEAPYLDSIKIGREQKRESDLVSRYRALKRLAIQGHDYEREHAFFVGELKALRGNPDTLGPNLLSLFVPRKKVWPGGISGSARYWFGLWYQWLSNFGRSLTLPLVWWLASTIIFSLFYLKVSLSMREKSALNHGFASATSLLAHGIGIAHWSPYLLNSSEAPCVVGPGAALTAAVGLSVRRALFVWGADISEKLNQIYACLYGAYPTRTATPVDLSPQFVPLIPDSVAYVGTIQGIFSTLLIFLFVLAIRNHFRIK